MAANRLKSHFRLRYDLTQLLMCVALAAIGICLTQTSGCSVPTRKVSSLAFSPDGNILATAVYQWQSANVPFKAYIADVRRTIELVNMKDLHRSVLDEETLRGNQGPASRVLKHVSLSFDPDGDAILPWSSVYLERHEWARDSADPQRVRSDALVWSIARLPT
jgi:WD40 repeat protein